MTSFDAMNTHATQILVRDRQRTLRDQAAGYRLHQRRHRPSALRVRTGTVLVRAGRWLARSDA
jgi:hypothetical protein